MSNTNKMIISTLSMLLINAIKNWDNLSVDSRMILLEEFRSILTSIVDLEKLLDKKVLDNLREISLPKTPSDLLNK